MSARARVLVVVGLAAAVAVAGVVGATLLQSHGSGSKAATGAVTKARRGTPPLLLDFGVRADPEAKALARAAALYGKGKRVQAGRIFDRYTSLPARIGSAFAAWPEGHGLDALKRLVASHPKSSLAELHLGWAYYWSGRNADAAGAWRQAVKLEPDTPSAVDAQDPLHPAYLPGLPPIVTSLAVPPGLTTLPAAQELAALARAAARPDADAKILYGLALWNTLRRPVSAEKQFRAAAALAPNDPMAQTAAAVGVFSKDRPVLAFSRLGPLTGTFPHSAIVRFHLGMLLLWTRQTAKAQAQLRLAVDDDPGSVYATQASAFLKALAPGGTKSGK